MVRAWAWNLPDIRDRVDLNPTATAQEALEEFTLTPAEKKKSILVIGGDPAGMEAARVAASREHKATLWEKGYELGGDLIPAAVPGFKHDYRRLINYLSTQIRKLRVTTKLGLEATPELIQTMKPDIVFFALVLHQLSLTFWE
jgi:NADPH-dependent 2,4-dienoyl-CoA reductase/sulfur reductase-like enzyme